MILPLDLFQAVNQLCSHFEAYRDVPKITELREKFKNIKQILKSHVFSDFSRYIFQFYPPFCSMWSCIIYAGGGKGKIPVPCHSNLRSCAVHNHVSMYSFISINLCLDIYISIEFRLLLGYRF